MKVTAEIKRLQRLFNSALFENDTEAAVEAGIDMVRMINSKPRPSKADQSYVKVVENMVVLLKSMDVMRENGMLEQMTAEERKRLPLVMIEMIVNIQKKRDVH
jgi:hypothetical protein